MQTHRTSWCRAVRLIVVLTTVACFNWPAGAQQTQTVSQPVERPAPANEQVVRITERQTAIKIVERFAKVVELDVKMTAVDGFDQDIVDVLPLSAKRIRVLARKPGVTSMVLTDEHGQRYTVDLFVAGDVRHLQSYIAQMFPNATVEAIKLQDSVVLRGWVTQPEHLTHIVEVAEQFYGRVINQMSVGGVQQVLMKVKIMEVQRSKIRQLGFNFLLLNNNGYLASTPGALTPLNEITAPLGGAPEALLTGLANPSVAFGFVGNSAIFQGFLDALRQEGLLKIHAEPILVTTNGRPATLLSGGEFPILVPQGIGNVSIEWKEFGTSLEAVPIILGEGRLRLELMPEVSERDFANAVNVDGLTVPGLTTRRVNTQVEMQFGQTLMIGGLLSSRDTAETQKVPFLGELPWIGAAFSRKRFDEVETELVIMVTPEYVAPVSGDQVPPGGPGLFTATPTDRELFYHGTLEVPNFGDECEGCLPPGGFPIVPPAGLRGPSHDPGLYMPAPPGELLPPSSAPPAPPVDYPDLSRHQRNAAGYEHLPVPRRKSTAANVSTIVPAGGHTAGTNRNAAVHHEQASHPAHSGAAGSTPRPSAPSPSSENARWKARTLPGLIEPVSGTAGSNTQPVR
jgi:pilus assembly protein CpaC